MFSVWPDRRRNSEGVHARHECASLQSSATCHRREFPLDSQNRLTHTAGVSAKNAQITADEFLSQLQLPNDASENRFQLVAFENEEDCRFFYPRRALDWQRQVNTYIARALRRRGVRVNRITIVPSDFHVWLGNRADSPELRRKFADKHLHFLGENARPVNPKTAT
jgi:hypothetical protein